MPLVKAKFQWDANDASELSFKVGDVIDVDDQTQEGWWRGTLNGKQGYFPNNYVELMPASSQPPSRGPSRGPSSRGPSRASNQSPQQNNGDSRLSSRVSTNVSIASGVSGVSSASRYSNQSGSSAYSAYSQGSRSPLIKSGSGNQQNGSRAPSRGPPNQNGNGIKNVWTGGSFQSNGSKTSALDFSRVSDAEWDQRARAKGAPPVLDQNVRYAAMDRILADTRRSTMFGGGEKATAKQLLGNAMRAVTIYDNTQNLGQTHYDDKEMMEKKKNDDTVMSWSPTASTENFTRTKVGVFASNLILGTAFTTFFFGPISIIWGFNLDIDDIFEDEVTMYLGVFAWGLSILLAGYEWFRGYERSGQPIPYRGVVYLLLAAPMFCAYPLYLTGAMLVIASIANFRSYMLREEIRPMKKKKKAAKNVDSGGIFHRISFWRESNKIGKIVFIMLYFVANIVIYIVVLYEWFDINDELDPGDRLSVYGPYAKGFGGTLDFNTTIILVPVARTFIRWLYNLSTRDQGFTSTLMRYILYFIPIDKTLAFHKLCAGFVLLGTIGHTFFHFINYIYAEQQTLALFGLSPWITGGALILIILVMYSAAMKNVRSFHFELFWYTHHLFIAWYVILLAHGDGGLNPNVWKYLILPGTLYTAERLLREYRSNREAVILSVTFLKPDCFSIRFAQKGVFARGYKEGQYIFINCPYVSKFEWHPFTLSSAPGEDAASLHIRIQNKVTDAAGVKSWTQQTKEYLELLCPRGAVYHEFISNAGQDVGVLKGPDGNAIIRVDGPHSAPTQHISEYQTSMIVGAGIGVTPLAATLKSIVHHRWRLAVGNAFPNNAHFYWVCAHRDLQAFRWMIRTIKDATDAVWNSRLKDEEFKNRSFSVTVFITSVPKDAPTPALESIPGDSVGFWGAKRKDLRGIGRTPAPFTEQEMYQVCMNPPKEPTQMCDLVTILNGRPKWDDHYALIAKQHPLNHDVGVMYCGNPAIAGALKESCARFSDVNKNLYFKLHKENF